MNMERAWGSIEAENALSQQHSLENKQDKEDKNVAHSSFYLAFPYPRTAPWCLLKEIQWAIESSLHLFPVSQAFSI